MPYKAFLHHTHTTQRGVPEAGLKPDAPLLSPARHASARDKHASTHTRPDLRSACSMIQTEPLISQHYRQTDLRTADTTLGQTLDHLKGQFSPKSKSVTIPLFPWTTEQQMSKVYKALAESLALRSDVESVLEFQLLPIVKQHRATDPDSGSARQMCSLQQLSYRRAGEGLACARDCVQERAGI